MIGVGQAGFRLGQVLGLQVASSSGSCESVSNCKTHSRPLAAFSVCAVLSKSYIAYKALFGVKMYELAIPKGSVVRLSAKLRLIWLAAPDPELV